MLAMPAKAGSGGSGGSGSGWVFLQDTSIMQLKDSMPLCTDFDAW